MATTQTAPKKKGLINFDFLQKLGKVLMTVIAVMPAAGLMISLGKLVQMSGGDIAAVMTIGTTMENIGWAVINNLHILFAVAIGGSWAKERAGGAFAAVLAFALINVITGNIFGVTSAMLEDPNAVTHTLFGQEIAVNGYFTSILGAPALNMGVFVGIIAGFVGGVAYNKYYNFRKLPDALAFFNGKRFVPMVVIAYSVVISMVLALFWPVVQTGINNFGIWIANSSETSPVLAPFIYGTLERLLIPTGLHHLVYTPFLYTSLGGTATVGGQVLEGARNIYYAEIADPSVAVLSQSVIWDARGISKMFGLIGACLAMYQTARPENREKIKPVLITAAVTSFIAGVTEPIEFSFLFVAPILFVVHAVLAGSSFVVLNLLGCRAIGPNGFIDFLLYNLPLGIGKTRWPVYIAVGVLYFFLYYVIFRVLIVKMNLHTLGREAEGMEMKLHSKSEYKAKVAAENGTAAAPAADNTVDAAVIVEALGGKDNILKVTNCYTRLRTELADPDKVQDDVLKNQTGASAVIHKGKNVQVVYGLKVNAVRKAVDAELGLSGED